MSPEVAAAVIAASVSFLTLIGTLAAQYFGRRATSKQLDRTLAEQRTRTLNERFATAAGQLGDDKPAVRLAGVYAMAGLADDWKSNRQTCVDVLCAYLRLLSATQQVTMSTSGWRDSNPRPRAPKARALAKLRYSPSRPRIIGMSAAPSTERRSQAATNPYLLRL
jgi:hypothetical protein